MEFLIFIFGYVGIFALVSVFVISSNASPFLSRLSGKLKQGLLKVIYTVVPGLIIRSITNSINYIFNTRNHVMQLVFGGLVMGGNIILMLDVLPLLYIFEPETNHIFLPLIFLFTNAAAFHLSCVADPGQVTSANATMLASLYKADGILYQTGAECRTCKIIKPPRSKHCSICQRCVHRFDHHCIWTNNCVGAGNLRYFLPFLISLIIMIINGAIMSTRAMVLLVQHLKIMESGYVDPYTGKVNPITIAVLIQHLFMQHPRCIFLITSLVMLTLLLGLFTLYHVYLMINNQTTNERYKIATLPSNNDDRCGMRSPSRADFPKRSQVTLSHADKTLCNSRENEPNKSNKNNDKKVSETCGSYGTQHAAKATEEVSSNNNNISRNKNVATSVAGNLGSFYDRGIFFNVREVFLPWADLPCHAKSSAGAQKKYKKR
ncbi:unnamed protein product [Lymnaea stagnalis]|uniref:Palmitoyltransferase n=1 Tax=Lymnaea stagnalis TaxID=6523 RepID=A0AAV2HT34_LYMST